MMYSIYQDNQLIGRLPNTETDTVARFLAGIPQFETSSFKVVDMLDILIVSTLGNLIYDVPDQEWLRSELAPLLYKYDDEPFEKVELIPANQSVDDFYDFVNSLDEE